MDNDADYLRDLAERLMRVPVMYGTNQCDCDRLLEIATKLTGDVNDLQKYGRQEDEGWSE